MRTVPSDSGYTTADSARDEMCRGRVYTSYLMFYTDGRCVLRFAEVPQVCSTEYTYTRGGWCLRIESSPVVSLPNIQKLFSGSGSVPAGEWEMMPLKRRSS